MNKTPTWMGDGGDDTPLGFGIVDWIRVIWRGLIVGGLTFGCLLIALLVRLVERPLYGADRPWTPAITLFVCRNALWLLGLKFQATGSPMAPPGAVVANHSSWRDIFALNATKRVYFVAKSEVASWPGIGWLARATGTVFIRRDAREAASQKAVFEERLGLGHKLLFFPEGTSTDGRRVLPFKPTLFAAFYAAELRDKVWVQPVTVTYTAPAGGDDKFYGWWGDMSFGKHLLKTLGAPHQGGVHVIWHNPLKVSDFSDRKVLAQVAEAAVRDGHPQGQIRD